MKVLDRKLLRNLRGHWGQAVAVMMVILCGVASLVCVLSAYRSLKLTRDVYYDAYRLADFWVPLEKAPSRVVREAAALPGVTAAQGRIVKDVNLDVPGNTRPCTGRVISMPPTSTTAINDIHLLSGRYFSPGVSNEVIVSDRFARENDLALGGVVWATMNDRKQPLRIIGTALSPEYVYMIRSAREFLPAPDRFAILWVGKDFAEMALGMRGACNEIVGFLEPRADVDAVLERLEDALKPYGALSAIRRYDQVSNRYLSDEIKGLGVSARITPTIFLGIAAMILMVMLDRVVQRERTAVGVLKAYGYSNAAIGGHYVKYALVLSLTGALGGVLVGQWLGHALMGMYVEFFEFPLLEHRFYPDILAMSLGISAFAGVLGASWAVAAVVRIDPAQAMRQAMPRTGHRLLLERVGFLWRNLGFVSKMILRDVFRYKGRSGVAVFGVMCSVAILLLGSSTGDSVDKLMSHEFNTLQKQDVRVAFYTELGEGAYFDARRFPYVRAAEPVLQYPFTLRAGWREKDVVVTGVRPGDRMTGLETVEGRLVDVGEGGLVLTRYIADVLHLGPGDTLVMKPLLGKVGRETTVRVRDVVEQYLGMGVYMNIRALSRVLDEPFAVNSVLLGVEQGDLEPLKRYLKDVPAVASVDVKDDSRRQFEETIAKSMAINNVFLGVFAGVIAFAIIYNTTAISLTERTRELASLRVLGFTLGEIRRIVFGQNALLALAGLALGIPLGVLLCRWMLLAYETDVYRFPFYISRGTFIKTVLAIWLFVFVANMASRRRIARLDMVEVLKSRE
ncbi:MAG: ABC transporter permease [Planctomycetes bacterium]|nr:ABC transporter permease [Planctomycetota bacterium]